MPPPVPSESESEPQDWSDSESVHSIENGPFKTEVIEPEEPSHYMPAQHLPVTRIPATEAGHTHGSYATDALVNGGKRKAESKNGDGDGRVAKARRTEFQHSDPQDFEEHSDDYEDNGDEDGQAPTHGAYVNQSFSAADGPLLNGTTSNIQPGNPSFPQTALDLFRQKYPDLSPQPTRPGNLFTHLAAKPVKQVPIVTSRFNDIKPQNLVSYLMQASGDAVPWDNACERCVRQNSVYRGACVVVRDPGVLEITAGACANCWYARQGSLCSFRVGVFAAPQGGRGLMRDASAPVGAQVSRAPKPAPSRTQHTKHAELTAKASAPAAPLHPSYAAALASGAVSVNTTPAAVPNSSSARCSSPSRDDKVRVWENRYGSMNTEGLLRAHEHLAEWQEDLTTRLLAMNRVVLERLKGGEGYS